MKPNLLEIASLCADAAAIAASNAGCVLTASSDSVRYKAVPGCEVAATNITGTVGGQDNERYRNRQLQHTHATLTAHTAPPALHMTLARVWEPKRR